MGKSKKPTSGRPAEEIDFKSKSAQKKLKEARKPIEEIKLIELKRKQSTPKIIIFG